MPQVRHRILGKAGFSHATGGRSKLVSNGIRLALHHPVIGVGTGGFVHAYAKQTHLLKGKEPKAAASHDTPVTVAAETGLPGLALLAWLVVAGFVVAVPAQPGRDRHRPRPSRVRTSLDRDRRAQPLLQRALRGPALLGAARAVGGRGAEGEPA